MARSVFLITSSLRGLHPVEGANGPLLTRYPDLIERIKAAVPGMETLFAEPFVSRTPDGLLADASWYTQIDSPSRRLNQLPAPQRAALLRRLQRHVDAVEALGDHPDAPLLRAMLSISGADAVMAVGEEPVLIDWGTVPNDDATDLDAGAAWAATTLAAIGLTVPWAPVEEAPGADETAGDAADSGNEASPEPPAQADAANSDGPEAVEAAAPFVAGAADDGADAGPATAVTAGAAATTAATAVTAAAPGVVYVEEPIYRRTWFGVLLAFLILLLMLLLLWWLLFAPGGLLARPFDPRAAQFAILNQLEEERDRLADLQQQGCGEALDHFIADGGYTAPVVPPAAMTPGSGGADAGVGEAGNAPAATAPAEPDAGGDTAAEAADPGAADANPAAPETPRSGAAGLARDLEHSVALVLGATGGGGVGMGSGFFIAPDLLVTNRHVVADMAPDSVLVTSESIGAPIEAQVIAITNDDEIGRPDFALLRLSAPPPQVRPLEIAAEVEKLSRVVTAGYPAFITGTDPQFQALMGGDAAAAPSMIFTSGEVSVVQRQFNGPSIIIHTADMSQGNSGGPLVDQCGRVVGVNTFISEDQSSGRRGLYSLGGNALKAFLGAHGVTFESADGACTE